MCKPTWLPTHYTDQIKALIPTCEQVPQLFETWKKWSFVSSSDFTYYLSNEYSSIKKMKHQGYFQSVGRCMLKAVNKESIIFILINAHEMTNRQMKAT